MSKLYRHYKNKTYKFIGTAKHSETLEDVVVYECLYDNPRAKVWVRPYSMFFEDVQVDGKSMPRFAPIQPVVHAFTEISDAVISILSNIIRECFGEWDPVWFKTNLDNHSQFHLAIAFLDGKPVGFKLGYELDKWCRGKGYRKIQTKSQNRFKEMLTLNLKFGFEIIGTHLSDEGGFKIILERSLK